ncbi:hypothetical protein, partial [Salmonella sp. s54395]|uniref:hypothetical protein n=1 Tax=Salmonella sp. s54395 TaxID=3159664 RepID=UPI0039805488
MVTTQETTTPCENMVCEWSDWCDGEGHGKPIFDDEIENRNSCKPPVCENPTGIECVTTLDEVPSD